MCILHMNAAHQFKCEILFGRTISTLRAKILAKSPKYHLISEFYLAFILFGHHRVSQFNRVL